MTIYTHNGVYYDLPTDNPEVAKQKIMAHLNEKPASSSPTTQFGRTAAAFADVIPNMGTSMLNAATYAGARAFQKSPEEATALANKVSQPLEPQEFEQPLVVVFVAYRP